METLIATPASKAGRIEQLRESLAELIARRTARGSVETSITGLKLIREISQPSRSAASTAQRRPGRPGPQASDGWRGHLRARSPSFLVTSVDLPAVSGVIEASKEKPYLALSLKLDQRAIAEMMVDCHLPQPRRSRQSVGSSSGEGTLPLFEAFYRLVALLDEPDDIPILAPLIQREILYRLVMSDQGTRLRQIASAGSPSHQIAWAIGWLKAHFAEPLRIDDLAARMHMSPSTFHHHFRSLTAMSPLQYQKWLRLTEGRRLMLSERLDAASASIRVGYESPSQFSREYRRQFGAPPSRDVASLRQMTASQVA